MSDKITDPDGTLPPEIKPMEPQGEPVAVEIEIELYKEIIVILQELPYRVAGQVMNKMAPGVKAVYAAPLDDGSEGGAE